MNPPDEILEAVTANQFRLSAIASQARRDRVRRAHNRRQDAMYLCAAAICFIGAILIFLLTTWYTVH